MKKILYLMGIDWYWIKQRPQIIAEMLDRDYDVTVAYYKEVVVKQSLRKNNDELEKSIPISAIPYRDKNIIAHFIQKILFQKVMKNVEQYDIVWISHPLLYRYLPGNYKGKIVYDCMDNHEALCSDENICQVIKKTEQQLVNRADIVFCKQFRSVTKSTETRWRREKCIIKKWLCIRAHLSTRACQTQE